MRGRAERSSHDPYDPLHDFLAPGEEETGYRAYEEGADNSANAEVTAEQEADGHKGKVDNDADNAEFLFDFV